MKAPPYDGDVLGSLGVRPRTIGWIGGCKIPIISVVARGCWGWTYCITEFAECRTSSVGDVYVDDQGFTVSIILYLRAPNIFLGVASVQRYLLGYFRLGINERLLQSENRDEREDGNQSGGGQSLIYPTHCKRYCDISGMTDSVLVLYNATL